jgi:triacylglycerol lipase
MKNIIVKSQEELNNAKNLLARQFPTYRQAYSDRTAWLMACLSELVYLKFNEPILSNKKAKLIKNASKLLDEQKMNSLNKLIDMFAYDSEEEKAKLKADLEILNMKIEKTFDVDATQAMIVSSDKFYVLAFRGTEPTSIKDIKSDAKAMIKKCETGGMIHSGFDEAFDLVQLDIQQALDTLEDEKPLFIAGHSLGGALATVATKKLTFKFGIAGCYTFGSPRVGNEVWTMGIKTPVYRLVNSADPVTMVPPSGIWIKTITLVLKFFPILQPIEKFLAKFAGYHHAGDMRFLTNIQDGDFNSVKLLNNVTLLRRLRSFINKQVPWSKIPSDHSITTYRKKLQTVAWNRQDISYVRKEV